MKRLFRIMPVVCVLVFVLAVHAFAVQDYLFEWYEVQVLPDFFDPDDSGQSEWVIYEGFLPEGQYDLYYWDAGLSEYDYGTFLYRVTVSYTYVRMLGCEVSVSSFVSDALGPEASYDMLLCLQGEEPVTMCSLSNDHVGQLEFAAGACLRFVPVADSPSEPVESFLPDVLVELFGPYEQQTETVTEVLADGSSVTYERRITGVAGLDWEWLSSVGLFALVVFCFFRIVGGVLKQ